MKLASNHSSFLRTELRTPKAMAGSGSFARHVLAALVAAVAISMCTVPARATGHNVVTQRGDVKRDGQFSNEPYLTPENVNVNQFGSLFNETVDGYIIAQPLYMSGVTISGNVVNAVYVETANDSIYAFNADTGAQLWYTTLLNSANGTTVTAEPVSALGCSIVNGFTQEGITGTPVIDPTTNTMYLVAKTMEVTGSTTNYVFRLHALDITTGLEKFGGPVVINASVGSVTLNTQNDLQRTALLELNGTIYIGFGSNGCDQLAHGWLLAYSASTLQQLGLLNTSPAKTYGSSLWMSGVGPSADSLGNIYLVTANGTFDVNTGGSDYGDTVMKLAFNGSTFTVEDYFTPFNQAQMAAHDLDLGSGAAVLLPTQSGPNPNLLVTVGKTGTIYLINQDGMGGYNPAGDEIVQELPGAVKGVWGAAVYWNNALYFAGRQDYIKEFSFLNGAISPTPIAESPSSYTFTGVPVVSANANANGLLWMVRNLNANSTTELLSAFNATTMAEIYNTNKNPGRDQLLATPHFATPLVANGKVYVGTQTELQVYGLLPALNTSTGNNQTATVQTQINLSAQAANPYTGVGISGVPVAFSDGGKGGTFTPASGTTGSTGLLATVYTLPQTAGTYSLTATSSGYTTATFTETATAGAAAKLAVISGSSQSGTVGTVLGSPLTAQAKDTFGNEVSGASITFADTVGGSFSPNPATTGSNGEASTTFTLPTAAHTGFAVTANSGTATAATFHETAVAGAPASETLSTGNKQSGAPGTQLPKPLVVVVKDQYGNPVSGITVNFAQGTANGVFLNNAPVTNSVGQASATYTLPTTAGTYSITATVGSYVVTFSELAN
jgi:Bacterial Ig-like domain (group 1)